MRFLALFTVSMASFMMPLVCTPSAHAQSDTDWAVNSYYAYARFNLEKVNTRNELIALARIGLTNRTKGSLRTASFVINAGYTVDKIIVGKQSALFQIEAAELGENGELLFNRIDVTLPRSYDRTESINVEINFSGRPEQLTDPDAGIAPTPAEAFDYSGFDLGHDGLTLPIFAANFTKVADLKGAGRGYARIVEVEVPPTHQVEPSDLYEVRGPSVVGKLRKYSAKALKLGNLIAVKIRPIS